MENKLQIFAEIIESLYEILTATYQKLTPQDPKEQKFLDLLHGLYVLEYRNHKL